MLPLVLDDTLQGRKGSICLVVSPLTALIKDHMMPSKVGDYQQLLVGHTRQIRKLLTVYVQDAISQLFT